MEEVIEPTILKQTLPNTAHQKKKNQPLLKHQLL